MAKKVSAVQRLVAFAMTVSEAELNAVLEVVVAIKANRFPRATPKAARKVRADRGTTRKVADAPSNGGDDDAATTG